MKREDGMYQTEGEAHAEAEVRVLAGKPGKKAYATPWTCSVAFTEQQWLICSCVDYFVQIWAYYY